VLLLLAGACSSVGSVSSDLVELYDQARPDGMIELELDRDGAIREMEAEVAIERLPANLVANARGRFPGSEVIGGERELSELGDGWEIQLRHEGRKIEVVYSDDGELLETERELDRSNAPAAVLTAAERALPNSVFRSVEIVERNGDKSYHVKRTITDVSYKLVLAPDGKLLRRVREHRAEIEVPLK
jgi:hypothetical protein